MRNALIVITAAAMAVGGVSAQETSTSLDDLFKKMDDSGSVQDQKTNVAGAEPVAETVQPDGDAIPAAVVEERDVDALVEMSRELYVGGEFEKAQQGFEKIVKIEPENKMAGMYLRQLLERDARRVEKDGMEEVRAGWDTRLVLRSYALSSDAAATMGLGAAKESTAVERHFPEVKFPAGSSAVYHSGTEKMFVRNTRENLAVLEQILLALDVSKVSDDVDQVEIEAKFIEVSEGVLEELGFEWRSAAIPPGQPGYPGGENISLFGDWAVDGNYYLFNDTLRGGPTGPDMPFSRPSSLGAGRSSTRFEDTFNKDPAYLELQLRGNTPLDVVISALDQSTGADVLSAPRVVTKSGKIASIRVGELHQYPELFEIDTTQATFPNISYEEFEEKLMGVELEVIPELNGDQIELSLNPRITELAGWRSYQIAPADSIYNHRQDKVHAVYGHVAVVAKLPIFKKREIETSVTIADGGTIGMGGLISEKIESFDDRVPILGHIPFLGRLFRNEGERAVKRNLMIFVTARKVEANGRINTEDSFE